jgi:pimeloyl-ACP methyl ester carboxylesterase/DNA-binding CsgD family transcriptional regulator/class 3 adenylate cyclase
VTAAIETRYARSGDVNIAYQVVGSGPIDLVFVMGWVSNIDQFWTELSFARFLHRLASFSRLIVFDKRGTGLSDRVPVDQLPSLEQRMDDVRAVMDAVGSRRAALVGVSEGGPLCLLFAATHPDRTTAVVVIGGYARRLRGPDHPFGDAPEDHKRFLERIPQEWGGSFALAARAPSAMGDERFVRWWGGYLRSSASPAAAVALTRMNAEIDVRHVLPTIRVPVLVVHRRGDRAVPVEAGKVVAEQTPSARFVELPGDDHLPFVGDQDAILDEVQRFLTGELPAEDIDRVLLTVLRCDLADAAGAAAGVGDRRWRDAVDGLDAAARREVAEHRGREIHSDPGEVLATFDGPARAVRCASAVVGAGRRLGLPVRAGLHTGECMVSAERVTGLAVEIAGRVAGHASAGEVVVSSTVRDLVAGSGLTFDDVRGQASGLPPGVTLLRLSTSGERRVAPTAGDAVPAAVAALTAREREIAGLVALGLTNRQIADELVISPATVDRHVANILVKLGAHGRAQIAAWAVAEGLAEAKRPSRD